MLIGEDAKCIRNHSSKWERIGVGDLGFPHLILPIRFESQVHFVSCGGKTLWVKEGMAVYAKETIKVYGDVRFYYVTIKIVEGTTALAS
jgi:hypothetical protein